MPGCQVLALAVGFIAGLLLSVFVVCLSWLISLSLLATVRGGTSFLCPKRQRNDAPPRAVANSDKENSQLKQTAKAESSNPAMTQTAKPRTWQPGLAQHR